jgi:nucleoside-diphosphate-sugar epimerase
MRIVVTGASGFIGRPLIASLAAHGHDGVAVGRRLIQGVPETWTALTRADALAAKERQSRCDAIIHLEVKHHVGFPTAADRDDFKAVNVEGTKTWLDWAEGRGVTTFVLASSVKAVDQSGGICDENAPLETSDAYGASKAAAEEAVRAWANTTPDRTAIILRFAPIYGPGNEANIASFARQVICGKPCLIGSGRARKSLLSRRNAVAAVEYVVTRKNAGCAVFNVSDGGSVAMKDLARLISDAARAPKPRHVPWLIGASAAKLGDSIELITGREFPLNSRKLKTLITDAVFPNDKLLEAGFVPPQTMEDGILEMVQWLAGRLKERVPMS